MSRLFAMALTALVSASAWSSTACPQHFAVGVPPTVTNPKLQARTQEVCFKAFAVLHSGVSRTALYAAEHLTRANLVKAQKLSRRDAFYPEEALPARDRAELNDYARSGYDRGHLAPSANFATRSAQAESFSLANMVPQVHVNNAGVWADIEAAVRHLATDEGELYVISGPAFVGGSLQRVGRVLKPTHLWKVVYSPRQQRAGAYVVTNDETRTYSAMSVSELQKLTGVNALPGASQKIRDGRMKLPEPQAPDGNREKGQSKTRENEGVTLRDYTSVILEVLKLINRMTQ